MIEPGEPGGYGGPLRALVGGYSGETYVAEVGPDRVVVRIYARDPARAAVDASLLRLVRGLLPVPQVLELRRPTADTPAVLVSRYVAGARLDLALAEEPDWLDLPTVGRSVGSILNTLAGIPFLRFAAFADGDLTLSNEQLPSDLRSYAERLRGTGRLSTWAVADWEALIRLVDLAEDVLAAEADSLDRRAVLTHSDVNPKNILVDPATSQVCALLDWEFAHAGSPFADLGNFCRLERDPRLVDPLLGVLTGVVPRRPAHRLRLGRAADLWSLLELAGGARPGPLPELASALLLAQSRTADLDAWPWPRRRVAPGLG